MGTMQGGRAAVHENGFLDPENSQGRESFMDDEDTENAVIGSGIARLHVALAATSSRGAGVLTYMQFHVTACMLHVTAAYCNPIS